MRILQANVLKASASYLRNTPICFLKENRSVECWWFSANTERDESKYATYTYGLYGRFNWEHP